MKRKEKSHTQGGGVTLGQATTDPAKQCIAERHGVSQNLISSLNVFNCKSSVLSKRLNVDYDLIWTCKINMLIS